MIFLDFKLKNDSSKYIQIADYIKERIVDGALRTGDKLPSTRQLSALLKLSRTTIQSAFQLLVDDDFIYSQPGEGYYVSDKDPILRTPSHIQWKHYFNTNGELAKNMDLIKTELPWKKNMISFTSIAPDSSYFDTDALKKSFLDIYSLESNKLLNYGYAKGYQPLIDTLKTYMHSMGIHLKDKDVLITNGFTEGLNLVCNTLTEQGDCILCENPTHHTALKIFMTHGLVPIGIPLSENGLDLQLLEAKIQEHQPKFLYLTPSYHNPTGMVISPQKRVAIINLCKKLNIPILEDGFNEELRFSDIPIRPLMSYSGYGNEVIYIGSFSKILFPGLRLGWVMADHDVIDILESFKRTMTIHTSTLDQAVLYQYMKEGYYDRYLKKVRQHYKEQYQYAVDELKKYIPYKKLYGEGGLHLFIEVQINARQLLEKCYEREVLFLPGDIFHLDDEGKNTLRLGISRVTKSEITEGFKIIGNCLEELL
ncbi:MocR-like pyridoxine biosynthesis transcription factor PdxR [Vallitalea okinawensis]|uniref:MocR-like pyridoxine biosynthesis transcription factor PdxR n=1 Tax=Vallitalea okinawensis TaxID=2078660 RepID=UPI000CFC06B9|nr:PLP-dependent aminotransferase family protein [Vallitalea okinawensis]